LSVSCFGRLCIAKLHIFLENNEESEECVNDTWLSAWNAIPPARPNVLRAFFAKITRNAAINKYNALNAEKRGGGELTLVLDELSEVVSGGGGPEDEIIVSELGHAISRFLKTLPERDANIVIRRYFNTEATKDIAELYGMTPGNVSVSLNRSRAKLKDYLREEGYLK